MDAQFRDPEEFHNADGVGFIAKDVTVKDSEGDDEATRIEVPVSGLAEDRDGDKLADSAIDSMVAQINEGGVPMFANHGYDADNGVPQAYRFEDIIGGWIAAERDGDIVTAEADLREGHESVEDLKDLFAQSMPVGFSIGFGWGEGDAEERETGGYRFRDVDLMEISPVGIQSHPDASTTGGMKVASALEAAGFDPADLDEERLAKALQDTMTENKEDDYDEEDEEEQESVNKAPEEIVGVIEAHMTAMMEDVREVMEGEGDMDDDEDEETEASDEDEDEEDEKTAELEKTVEELRAELEAVKTDAAGTGERKGGIETTETDDEQETKDETPAGQTDREFARNLV